MNVWSHEITAGWPDLYSSVNHSIHSLDRLYTLMYTLMLWDLANWHE